MHVSKRNWRSFKMSDPNNLLLSIYGLWWSRISNRVWIVDIIKFKENSESSTIFFSILMNRTEMWHSYVWLLFNTINDLAYAHRKKFHSVTLACALIWMNECKKKIHGKIIVSDHPLISIERAADRLRSLHWVVFFKFNYRFFKSVKKIKWNT